MLKRIVNMLIPSAFCIGLLLIFGAVGGLEQGVMTAEQSIGTGIVGLLVTLISGLNVEKML